MSFFDPNYQTPDWYIARQAEAQTNRRQFLKSAMAVSSLALLPSGAFAQVNNLDQQTEPWRTFAAVLDHLLPASDSGPSAGDIQALNYLFLLLTEQPIDQAEKEFVTNGVKWLNGFTQQQYQKTFVELDFAEKEAALRGIARSRAGENWLSTLLSYLFEAMLAPAAYGGNPNGIGWQWLSHQPGFPMPSKGKRYFELTSQTLPVKTVLVSDNNKKASS